MQIGYNKIESWVMENVSCLFSSNFQYSPDVLYICIMYHNVSGCKRKAGFVVKWCTILKSPKQQRPSSAIIIK
jgi:hypothetical protein